MAEPKRSCLPVLADDEADCVRTSGAVTNEEVVVLTAMRELKAVVRELKHRRRLAAGAQDAATVAEVDQQLAAHRIRWQQLEQEREAAWRRRMIMLGHLEE